MIPSTQNPEVSFCQSLDCTKLYVNIDDFGAEWFALEDILITVVVQGAPTTLTATSIFTDVVSSGTGVVTIAFGSNAVIGAGTSFLSEVSVGDYICFNSYSTELYKVTSVIDNTHLTVNTAFMHNSIVVGEVFRILDLQYIITPTMVGGTTSIPSGDYNITVCFNYPAAFINTSFCSYYNISVCCTNYCCVYEKIAEIANSCDDCVSHEDIMNAMFAWALLMAANGAAGCGNVVDSNTILNKLEQYCNIQPCNC